MSQSTISVGQTRKSSAFEAFANICVGICLAFVMNQTVLPLFGVEISLEQNVYVTTVFTLASFVRSYCIRRFWNWRHLKASEKSLTI